MKQPKLDVGMILTAKKDWTTRGIRGVLIAGNEYAVNRRLKNGFTVILESNEEIEFTWEDFDFYFDVPSQGMKVEVSEHISEVRLRPSEGFVVDVENSNISKGIIKYKKVEPKLPMSMEDLGDKITGWFITDGNRVVNACHKMNNVHHNQNIWPSREWAESVQAQCKLVRLRDAWNGEWKIDLSKLDDRKYINLVNNNIEIGFPHRNNTFLCFENDSLARQFLETFKDLIEIYFKPYKS